MTGPGHVVIAPDKFKGSLRAAEVAASVQAGLHRFRPELDLRPAPVADGGDGILEALAARGYRLVPVQVSGPTGERVAAVYGRLGNRAVVELAEASGLRRLPGGRLDPLRAGSRGTGELLLAALDAGCDEIILGLGGSACTDGGAGMLQALGVRLLDRRGGELGPGGLALMTLHEVDLSGLDARLGSGSRFGAGSPFGAVRIVLASDVDNPLLGPAGAAAVYAPQKGADPGQVAELEAGLAHWARLLTAATGRDQVRPDQAQAPGAGAAGGVGFAALTVLQARLRPGIALMLDLIEFEALLPGARLVITGEGSLDEQSLHGKAPVGVAAAAARHGVPVVAVAGRCTLTADQLRAGGLAAGYALTSLEPDPEICIRDAARLLEQLAATRVGPDWLG